MQTRITQKNYTQLIKGASLFTTGGGIPFSDQLKSLQNKNVHVALKRIEDFAKGSYLCAAAELGPTTSKPLAKQKYINKMLQVLTQMTGKDIQGFYPPELGQEAVLIESATMTKLPIADFDPVGFRSVPCVDIHAFKLLNIPFQYSPMVILTDKGEILGIDKIEKDARLEDVLRSLTHLSNSNCLFVMGGVVNSDEICKSAIPRGSYSRALALGKVKNLQSLTKEVHASKIIKGIVVGKEELQKKGFLFEKVKIKDTTGKIFTLTILNETIFLTNEEGNILASVPERILLIDPVSLMGLSSAKLHVKQKLVCLVVEPEDIWKTQKAQKLFGKGRFEFLLS